MKSNHPAGPFGGREHVQYCRGGAYLRIGSKFKKNCSSRIDLEVAVVLSESTGCFRAAAKRRFHNLFTEKIMVKVGLLVQLQAKAGKETVVAKFLADALALANQEVGTLVWFALQSGPSSFAIFDAFADDAGRKAHLAGPIAAALMANASELLSVPPKIEQVTVLAAKVPG
jgi:quinol monooxygenase YgiN